jgi:four helix bundle protein
MPPNRHEVRRLGECKIIAGLKSINWPASSPDLARQLRRAAVSIGSNIAEGCGRSTRPDLRNFLGIALGSATELEFQLHLCLGARLADPAIVNKPLEKTKRVQQMLTRLIIRVGRADC